MEFETHKCMSLVCFGLLFCLRTSKSLSMEDFDKCKICMGIFYDLGLKFGINLHQFAIYACISPIKLSFGFVEL